MSRVKRSVCFAHRLPGCGTNKVAPDEEIFHSLKAKMVGVSELYCLGLSDTLSQDLIGSLLRPWTESAVS